MANFAVLHTPTGNGRFVHASLVDQREPGRTHKLVSFTLTQEQWIDFRAEIEGSDIELRADDRYAREAGASA